MGKAERSFFFWPPIQNWETPTATDFLHVKKQNPAVKVWRISWCCIRGIVNALGNFFWELHSHHVVWPDFYCLKEENLCTHSPPVQSDLKLGDTRLTCWQVLPISMEKVYRWKMQILTSVDDFLCALRSEKRRWLFSGIDRCDSVTINYLETWRLSKGMPEHNHATIWRSICSAMKITDDAHMWWEFRADHVTFNWSGSSATNWTGSSESGQNARYLHWGLNENDILVQVS